MFTAGFWRQVRILTGALKISTGSNPAAYPSGSSLSHKGNPGNKYNKRTDTINFKL